MGAKERSSINKILEENKLLFLSTTNPNGNPESCSVYYVFDKNFNIYIWTDDDSRHAKNLKRNKNVSVAIANTSQKWGSLLRGLQIEGKCEKVSILRIAKPGMLYLKRYPKVKSFIKSPSDFLKKYDSKMFKITPSWIKIFDEKVFGKEVWKEVRL